MTSTDPAGDDAVPERFQVDFTGQTVLGQYRIERRLADGGMGSVYLAEDSNLGRKVVVKVPHARFLGEPGFRARFRREIEELVRLEHPHVVRILARGEQDGIPFFVLQFLGGGSLEDRLGKGAETPEGALRWVGTIADTLDFVHERGVVHRDVKPANILFDEAGHVFLSDFGVVKALGEKEGAELTDAGTGIGSPLYMAPEQGMGRGVSPASDQYALASALYEALAGEPPFGRGSVVELLVRKGREDAPPIRRLVPALPEACQAAIARALAREPNERFPTCREFVNAYRRGIVAEISSAPARSRVPVFVVSALVAVFAAMLVATRGFGLWRKEPPPAPPASAHVEAPMIMLRVLTPGAEPRRLLHWSPTVGRRESWRTRSAETQSFQLDDNSPRAEAGVSEQDVEVVVSEVDADGRALLAWTFHPELPVLDAPATPGWVARRKKLADDLGTITGTSRLTSTGVSFEVSLKSDRDLDVEAQRYLIGLEQTMRNMSTRLPDDPVGVGAKWETTEIKDLAGITYQEIVKYTVVGVEGDRIRIEFEFDAQAPDQPLSGAPADVKLRVHEFTFKGGGSSTIDLNRVAPIENVVKVDIRLVSEAQGAKQGKVRVARTVDARTTAR